MYTYIKLFDKKELPLRKLLRKNATQHKNYFFQSLEKRSVNDEM